jgi:hypothetical protein
MKHQQNPIVARQAAQFVLDLVLLFAEQHARKRGKGGAARQSIEIFLINAPPTLSPCLA